MHTVIIGNGISGITTARWLRKIGDNKITVISSESEHFFSRTALMYIYMGHMRYEDTKPYEDWFWKKNRIDLVFDKVTNVSFDEKVLAMESGKNVSYDQLVLATGSKSNKFGWPGQDLDAVSGLYSLQDLEMMEKHSADLKRAVIVGGGLIGIEMAEMFHSRDIPVTMLVREKNYWDNVLPAEESTMVTNHIRKNHIDLRLEKNLKEIIDDGTGKASGVIVAETGEKLDCGFVGLTPGVSPNVGFLKGGKLEIEKGIMVNEFLETNIPDVYAIGDCAQRRTPVKGRRPIEAVWYTGRIMGETLAYTIMDKKKEYEPGIWFNSAKFIDIEYQVYGDVPNEFGEGLSTFYWEHLDGEKSIRLVYDTETERIKGFNLMGIRYRHEVCEKWIKEETPIDKVLENMALANFDPEFYKMHEQEVLAAYNKATGKKIKSKQKRSLDRVLQFLGR